MTEQEPGVLEPQAEEAIVAECQRVIVSFAHRLDHRQFADAAQLFADDGEWERHGDRLIGRTQILEVISARAETVVERHVMTNIAVEVLTPTRARAVSYVMIFRGDGASGSPVTLAGPQSVGEFHDTLRLTEDGWRLSSRSAVAVFRFQENS